MRNTSPNFYSLSPAFTEQAQESGTGFQPVVLPPFAPHGRAGNNQSSLARDQRPRRAISSFLEPLNDLASNSRHLLRQRGLCFGHHGEGNEIPFYQFIGPRGGGDPMRLGIFATIHGDEPESGLGLLRFLQELVRRPSLAQGFIIDAYPLCNPTGYEDATRCTRGGKDLNREFWSDSKEPEVRLLEKELKRHHFQGIVSLHCDDTSHGLYGFLSGRQPSEVLSASLLEPGLRAGEEFLPRNHDQQIDGFHAHAGILSSCYDGVLRAPDGLAQPPFEITFETPQRAPVALQIEAFNAALLTILVEYRQLLAHAPNL